MRRALLISPYFPPMGVSGAKRALHLARNLPAEGWTPIVLAGPPVKERHDPDLAECIPPGTIVSYGFSGLVRPWLARKARERESRPPAPRGGRPPWKTLVDALPVHNPAIERVAETVGGAVGAVGGAVGAALKSAASVAGQALPDRDWSFLTPFDRYLADLPAGLEAARQLIHQHEPQVIHVSADPWSPLITALQLTRETRLPLVVDFRDPWSLHAGKMALRPAVSRRALELFEYELFQAAAKIVLNTETCRDAYVEAYAGRIPASRFAAVRNAFDPGLFLPAAPQDPALDSPFTVLYFGRFRRFVEPDALLDGFARFVAAEGLDPSRARLTFVGGLDDEHAARAAEFGLEDHLFVMPPVPFRHSLPVLRAADALALIIEPGCQLQIPGKLYDYLCAGRPILAVSANEEANRIVREAGAGLCPAHGDPAAVAEAIATLYRARQEGRELAPTPEAIEPYSARVQARAIADIYDSIAPR